MSALEQTDIEPTSLNGQAGTKRTFQDVRCMFAFGGNGDVRQDL
jgi:hypothetical protein